MKKIIFITLLIGIFKMLNSQSIVTENYIVNENQFSLNSKSFNLESNIDRINEILQTDYLLEHMPGSVGYYYENSPINFFVDESTAQVQSTLFCFYSDDYNPQSISIQIDDFKLKSGTTYPVFIQYLNDNSINYTIKEYSKVVKILIKDSRIISVIFSKDNLDTPYRLQFK